jgi:outer membrane protein TolC
MTSEQQYSLSYRLPTIVPLLFLFLITGSLAAQPVLPLKEALRLGVENYGQLKAKTKYAKASKLDVERARLDYLPDVNLSAQVAYGSANGQNGPLYGFGQTGIASSGTPIGRQDWNAAFGSLYLTNVNWDFFAFGRSIQRIKTAEAVSTKDEKDRLQELFQEQVRVAAAYLNLLAAQRLTASYRRNLERADTLRRIIVQRAVQDLVPGVDSSQANAEVSNARTTLLQAMDFEAEQNDKLIELLGTSPTRITTDTLFVTTLPRSIPEQDDSVLTQHPLLEFYKSRIAVSDAQSQYYQTFSYPTFSLGGVFAGRGSGFGPITGQGTYTYSPDFVDGLHPERANYLLALGVTWNFTQLFRVRQQVRSQRLISAGLKDEFDQLNQELASRLLLAETKLRNAIADYHETPVQVKAALDAWHQKTVLYDNGLTNLVDVTQTLYALIRAETDRDIAFSNVWQALLLKAGAIGDFTIFSQNL